MNAVADKSNLWVELKYNMLAREANVYSRQHKVDEKTGFEALVAEDFDRKLLLGYRLPTNNPGAALNRALELAKVALVELGKPDAPAPVVQVFNRMGSVVLEQDPSEVP